MNEPPETVAHVDHAKPGTDCSRVMTGTGVDYEAARSMADWCAQAVERQHESRRTTSRRAFNAMAAMLIAADIGDGIGARTFPARPLSIRGGGTPGYAARTANPRQMTRCAECGNPFVSNRHDPSRCFKCWRKGQK